MELNLELFVPPMRHRQQSDILNNNPRLSCMNMLAFNKDEFDSDNKNLEKN